MRFLAFALALGCSAAPRPAPVIVSVEVRETERRAPGMMDAAMELIDGNVGGLVHLEQVRAHPTTWSITRLGGYGKLCEDLGLDPIFDVDEFFVAAPDVGSCIETVVLRHHLSPERVEQTFAELRKNSREPAVFVAGLSVPAIAVRTRERPQVIFAPRPDHIVMVPRAEFVRAAAFVRATPLPPSRDGEAWIGWGSAAGWPLLGTFVQGLVIPSADVTTYLGERHVMHARAHATSPAEARTSADRLQRLTDRVLRLPIVGAMILDPIDFRVKGSDVFTDIALRPSEHEWLLAQMDDGCW